MASLLEWDEDAVGHFLHTHGFPDLSAEIHGNVSPLSLPPIARVPPSDSLLLPSSIPEHAISGEVLAMLESDDLKDIGVSSLGMRLGILKAVEALKLEQGLTSAPDDAYDLSCQSTLPVCTHLSSFDLSCSRAHSKVSDGCCWLDDGSTTEAGASFAGSGVDLPSTVGSPQMSDSLHLPRELERIMELIAEQSTSCLIRGRRTGSSPEGSQG